MPMDETSRFGSPDAGDHAPSNEPKRLPAFILTNLEAIIGEWEKFAKTLKPSADGMTSLALRDHIHEILGFIIDDIKSAQTPKEQTSKSRGMKQRSLVSTAAETHAALRLTGGFDIGQMVSEYRALRASIIKLWYRTRPRMDDEDVSDLTRFNESIDQELAESVSYYTNEVLRSKDLFVGILGHDLRSPVQAIMLSAELSLHIGTLSERQTMLSNSILESTIRINKLIDNLLDVTRARFGAGLPIVRSAMDMGFVGHQIVEEIRVVHPARTINVRVSGDLRGKWDKARIGQVFSNLLGNAIQYGFVDTPIDLAIFKELKFIIITVHNNGRPIDQEKIATIFNPLTRAATDGKPRPGSMNLGLGLYITEEVVVAHGGTIHVSSSEEMGTTFTARIPRFKAPALQVV